MTLSQQHPSTNFPSRFTRAYIKTKIPTSVGFGRGKDAKLLYITADSSLYRIRINREGYHLPPLR